MSYLLFRPPVKTSHFPSGDQPCRYDGVCSVICFGLPRVEGKVKTLYCPPWLALWSLIPSMVPSKDKTWSLLLFTSEPVLSNAGCLAARSKRMSRPQPVSRPLTL